MRLINADVLKIESQKRQEGIERYGEEQADCFYSSSRELSTEWWCVEDMIDNTPTVDAPERKVGKWKEIDFANYKALCSECGTWSPIMGRFCPNCGAKMERSEE